MNTSFNFNKIPRSFMNVVLKTDESEDPRRLQVKMPMKKTFEKISAVQKIDMEDMTIADAYDTLGALMAEILSNNLNGVKVTTEEVTDNYDTEEISAFIDAYMDFVNGKAKSDPN